MALARDSRRVRVYTPGVALPKERTTEQASGAEPQPPHRRRPPGQAEQARRKQWGRTWGSVGAEYRKQRLAEGK